MLPPDRQDGSSGKATAFGKKVLSWVLMVRGTPVAMIGLLWEVLLTSYAL